MCYILLMLSVWVYDQWKGYVKKRSLRANLRLSSSNLNNENFGKWKYQLCFFRDSFYPIIQLNNEFFL